MVELLCRGGVLGEARGFVVRCGCAADIVSRNGVGKGIRVFGVCRRVVGRVRQSRVTACFGSVVGGWIAGGRGLGGGLLSGLFVGGGRYGAVGKRHGGRKLADGGPVPGHDSGRQEEQHGGCRGRALPDAAQTASARFAGRPFGDAEPQRFDRCTVVAGRLFQPLQGLRNEGVALRLQLQVVGVAPAAVACQVVGRFHGSLFRRQFFRLRLPFWM